MPRLLVSVRSADEAKAAIAGGAHVLDVKEPSRGPLGAADPSIWQAIRASLPLGFPMSVALGELPDWEEPGATPPTEADFLGIRFRKLGLAGAGEWPDWPDRWLTLRRAWGSGPAWIAVIYADWQAADAPNPERILEQVLSSPVAFAGILIDTWDKTRTSPLDAGPFWSNLIARAQDQGLLVTLAGGLDVADFRRLAPLEPDLFAVRGAACALGQRQSSIDPERVARLAQACREQESMPI